MKNLESLLQRFRKSLFADEERKNLVSSKIKELTGVLIPEEKIFYKDGVLELEASSAAKNEIRLKEERIIAELDKLSLRVKRVLYR